MENPLKDVCEIFDLTKETNYNKVKVAVIFNAQQLCHLQNVLNRSKDDKSIIKKDLNTIIRDFLFRLAHNLVKWE